jgi:hypothetical protein
MPVEAGVRKRRPQLTPELALASAVAKLTLGVNAVDPIAPTVAPEAGRDQDERRIRYVRAEGSHGKGGGRVRHGADAVSVHQGRRPERRAPSGAVGAVADASRSSKI